MKIRHELVRDVVLALAGINGQESLSTDIANKYQQLGGGNLPLYCVTDPVGQSDLVRRNRLNLFRPVSGWLQGRTEEQRQKIQALIPAILAVLPDDLAARLLVANSIEYRALEAAEESIRTAKREYMRTKRELFIRDHQSVKNDSGPAGNQLVH